MTADAVPFATDVELAPDSLPEVFGSLDTSPLAEVQTVEVQAAEAPTAPAPFEPQEPQPFEPQSFEPAPADTPAEWQEAPTADQLADEGTPAPEQASVPESEEGPEAVTPVDEATPAEDQPVEASAEAAPEPEGEDRTEAAPEPVEAAQAPEEPKRRGWWSRALSGS